MVGAVEGSGKWIDVFKSSQHRVVDVRAALCHDLCIRARRDGAELPSRLFETQSHADGLRDVGTRIRRLVGQFAVPGLSDLFGRRVMAVLGFVGAAVFVYLLKNTGANPPMLFTLLFLVSFCCLGNIALITGPISTESAPPG